ncbi:MAG: hypothetical protein PHD57_05925 [Desulfobacterales bacterium]|nr:hypothetical protein [Desulfobacterales bacterium]MDD3082755.1 hypothetical protein [Desulfobacterales bacterium]MDD3951538.1 hypothetical protein [Desulfobacterales bacterium]
MNPAFILKIEGRPDLLRPLFDLRKHSLFPLLNHIGILLIRTKQRPLAAQAQPAQQPADGCVAELDSKLPVNQNTDHPSSPKRKGKLHLKGIVVNHHPVNPGQLASAELLRTARSDAGFQPVPSPGPVTSKPVVNAGSRKTQGFYDFFGAFPILNPLNGSDADFFHSLWAELSSILCFHT